MKRLELRGIVDAVLALYEGLPGIRWEVDLDPDVNRVELDPQQIRRVLINLIDNAITAMDGEGTVSLSTLALGRDGSVRIEVADNGPGIPPGDRDRMFLPYFSTKKRGSGLGLAIVHKVVTDHEGTIRIENNEPRGTRFVIELPAQG